MRSAILLLWIVLAGCEKTPAGYENISLMSESSNRAVRVWIYEHPDRFIDRNFAVWVERTADGSKTNIFESPDEGRPIGTERIIWNRDHSEFVLVGKEFLVEEPSRFEMETLYLWYDIKGDKLFCNAIQKSLKHFTKEDLSHWDSWYENDKYRVKQRKRD